MTRYHSWRSVEQVRGPVVRLADQAAIGKPSRSSFEALVRALVPLADHLTTEAVELGHFEDPVRSLVRLADQHGTGEGASDHVEDVHQDVEDRQDGQQAATDDGDPANVAPDVGVLLGRTRRQRRR
jgi:hypothetical protein